MLIKYCPITDTDKVCKLYSEKDGVSIKYVCTTEFHDAIADIFYRETPHPEFGNKYFAILFRNNKPYIANADGVEDLTFGMVENDEGNLEYSVHRHDYKSFQNGNMIDGGRDYVRYSGKVTYYKVKNGEIKNVS